ncbi:hypothetical protein GY45DRAFT_1249049 [Cubamyces sp. BRFM 1775]|nr:hypothetical protein GY45DRAFT_1249049 [Cubamyces sp. BRFM 1775]
MSFENASVTKCLMLGFAFTSLAAGIFDLKHYLNLQLVPHISKHHQYWRLLVHPIACSSSSDLLLLEVFLYNTSICIERAFGSIKYASFLIISAVTTILLSFTALLVAQLTPVTGTLFNNIPPGPIAIMAAVLYQYMRLVPPAYHFRIFGVGMSDKVWVYATAAQLVMTRFPDKLLPAAVGLLAGYLYRSDFLQLKTWRVSTRAVRFAKAWVQPLLGEEKPVRRTTRALPETRAQGEARRRASALNEDEPVTTARNARPSRSPASRTNGATTAASNTGSRSGDDSTQDAAPTGGTVRQWMTELGLGGGPRPVAGGAGTVRAPSESEINILTSMFPDLEREVVLGVLQRRCVPVSHPAHCPLRAPPPPCFFPPFSHSSQSGCLSSLSSSRRDRPGRFRATPLSLHLAIRTDGGSRHADVPAMTSSPDITAAAETLLASQNASA